MVSIPVSQYSNVECGHMKIEGEKMLEKFIITLKKLCTTHDDKNDISVKSVVIFARNPFLL